MNSKINLFRKKMKEIGSEQIVIDTFSYYYKKVENGETGLLSKEDILPPDSESLIKFTELNDANPQYLENLAIIKLNGGLGTSMGLKKAKSLLPIKEENTFLDVIAKQTLYLREKTGKKIPLLFMNSFNTEKDTQQHLSKFDNIQIPGLPIGFNQNQFPKVRQDNMEPLQNSNDLLNWNPPGHGDIFTALANSGTLDQLLEQKIKYIFVSNSDNLGAVVDQKILTYFASKNIPFMMEVCNRTEMDKKGGHLAKTKAGNLILRESAQCPENETDEFQNINLYSYFNTNSLWINIEALKEKLIENNNVLKLPLIKNSKVVDGVDVYQIETAMGAAISIFDGAKALIVPRDRFSPVKKTNDIFSIWSDAYVLTDDFRVILDPELEKPPIVKLDDKYYKTIDQLQDHIKGDCPSLKNCKSLSINGEVFFGNNIKFEGDVVIKTLHKTSIENADIKGKWTV